MLPVPTFGERLKDTLHALGVMDKQVAAEMGISTQSFSRYVGTSRIPRHETLRRIADALSSLSGRTVSVDQLLADVVVTHPVTPSVETRATKGGRVADPFASIRWEWERLSEDDQLRALHQMQDVLRSFSRGVRTRGRDAS